MTAEALAIALGVTRLIRLGEHTVLGITPVTDFDTDRCRGADIRLYRGEQGAEPTSTPAGLRIPPKALRDAAAALLDVAEFCERRKAPQLKVPTSGRDRR